MEKGELLKLIVDELCDNGDVLINAERYVNGVVDTINKNVLANNKGLLKLELTALGDALINAAKKIK